MQSTSTRMVRFYTVASTSAEHSREELGAKTMRMMSTEEVIKVIVDEREASEKISWGVTANEIFKTIGLSFKNSKSLESSAWADLSENTNEDDDEMYETRKTVLQDTNNSVSLAKSGPTSTSADQTLKKLLFP